MSVTLKFNLQAAQTDWQIYWRLQMENPDSTLAEEHRQTIRSQLPQAILDMEITPEIKERVMKLAAETEKQLPSISRTSLLRGHVVSPHSEHIVSSVTNWMAANESLDTEKIVDMMRAPDSTVGQDYLGLLENIADEWNDTVKADLLAREKREAAGKELIMGVSSAFINRIQATEAVYRDFGDKIRVTISKAFMSALWKRLAKQTTEHRNRPGQSMRKRRRYVSKLSADMAQLKIKMSKKEGEQA